MALPFSDMVIIGEAYKDIKTSFIYICQSPYLKSVGYFIGDDIIHRIVYQDENYIVKKIRRGYYVYNRNRKDDEHTHIYTLGTCKKLLQLIKDRKVPDSSYLRESVLRICKDEKLIRDVEYKIKKDKDRQKYHNVQNGVRT